MFFPQGQQGDNSPSCTDMIKEWWKTVPFFNRGIFWGCTGIYILSFFVPSIDIYGINIPAYTIEKFQIWRIVTACFVHIQLLQLIFCIISLLPTSAIIEKQLGSTLFFINLIAEACLIQILFTAIGYILTLFIEVTIYSAGLWSIVMIYITLRSLANPEQETNFLCFPIQIKQKYYPWLILLLFSIFSLFQIVDLFCGILVGYFEHKYFKGRLINLSDQSLQYYEVKYFSSVKNDSTYIDVHQAGGGGSQIMGSSYQQRNEQLQEIDQSQQQRNQPAFGGSGFSIGQSRPAEVQNKINEFHQERIEAQQRRLEALQLAQGQAIEQHQQQQKEQEFKQFGGKGISLGNNDNNKAQKKSQNDYISLVEDSKLKEEESGDFL